MKKLLSEHWKRRFLVLFLLTTVCFLQPVMQSFGAERVGDDIGVSVTLSNPIHHCTGESGGSDYTEWSYVYFGSYPQSEVTDTDTISAIDTALLALGQTKGDVEVDGTCYRKVDKSDANQTINFGDSEYRYFK